LDDESWLVTNMSLDIAAKASDDSSGVHWRPRGFSRMLQRAVTRGLAKPDLDGIRSAGIKAVSIDLWLYSPDNPRRIAT